MQNLSYGGDDFFTAPGSYFHFTEPFPQLFPGLGALHCSYNLQPLTISDCLLTVGLHMTRERRGLWKTDPRNTIRSEPYRFEKTCFLDQVCVTTRAVFAGPDRVVARIDIRNDEAREIRFRPRLMGGWFQTGRARFAHNRLTLQHRMHAPPTWRTVVLEPSFRVTEARVAVASLNVHCEWPQLEGSRFGAANMYELLGDEVRLPAGRTHRFEVMLWLGIGKLAPPPPPAACGTFAPAARRAKAAWDAHARKAVLVSADTAVAERYAYAKYVLRSNQVAPSEGIRYPVSFAHKKLSGMWFWDTCFHALGWTGLDRVTAENHIRALVERQLPNGLIPQVITNRRIISGLPQPPVLPFMAFELYRWHRHDAFMRQIMPAIERLMAWWERHRFDSCTGLFFYLNPFDSGWDNSVRYDEGRGWLAPDLNTMMVRNLECQEYLYRQWGETARAAVCAAKLARLSQAVRDHLWDERAGFFCDGDLRSANRRFRVKTPAGFLPLAVPGVSAAQQRAVLGHLLNAQEFWLPHGLPTVAADDPRFVPWEYSYPRGTAWMSFGNWLTYHALRRAGLDAAAHALALRTLRTTCDCPRPSIYEHYNPLTGAGHGYAMFGWTSAVLIDLIRREYGVDFTDAGEWIFSAPLTPTNYEFSVTVRGRQVRTVGAAGRTVVTIDGKQVATLECGNRCILDDQFAIRDTRSLRLPA